MPTTYSYHLYLLPCNLVVILLEAVGGPTQTRPYLQQPTTRCSLRTATYCLPPATTYYSPVTTYHSPGGQCHVDYYSVPTTHQVGHPDYYSVPTTHQVRHPDYYVPPTIYPGGRRHPDSAGQHVT